LAVSKGLERDRAVDETGGQMAVFGRLGSRPFTREEMEKLFLTRSGVPWKVSDKPDMSAWIGGGGSLRRASAPMEPSPSDELPATVTSNDAMRDEGLEAEFDAAMGGR